MSGSTRSTVPKPMEFFEEGRRFVQYGMSPVRMAALRASLRKAAKGTRKNPIIKNGKEYVYTQDGRLIMLEHLNREIVKRHTLSADTALTKEKAERLIYFEKYTVEPDEECPELTDEQISEILQKAVAQKRKHIEE